MPRSIHFYVIDAYKVAQEADMGRRINTVMQTCFFAISGILPREQAIAAIKHAVEKTYGRKGRRIAEFNYRAIDKTVACLHRVPLPGSRHGRRGTCARPGSHDFIHRVTLPLIGRPRRPAARFAVPGRRHLADRHGAPREA